ncbi:hypothetical protein CVD25_08225 [Bacillus canaveralius]|uniref:HAD family hydrolase n=2 Tax=Bacillus TaxID=1386 RepID=A0A2N5GIF6_9BACI|nr:HAD hydrolase-like protein [Bacillus canaveralius]PLR80777.1 hypothetical protein CU635_17145 [Bacillus canaveralius]PLR98345.1 hypothetical protein CVD25_08225 [Bacillus canaveralius]
MKVLWDLDGTIIDSWPTLVEAFIQVSGKDLDREDVLPRLKYGTAYSDYGVPAYKITEFRDIERIFAHDRKPLFPFVQDVLLRADLNVLVTHRNRRSTEALLDYWDLSPFFMEVICPEDDGYSPKPDIDAYEYLQKRYGIQLAIGDQETDLIPARALGMATCSFQNPNEYADYCFSCYSEFKIF